METGSSLPRSQVPAYCPYPEPVRSSPYRHIPLPISSAENKLQKAAYTLNQIITEYDLTIFLQKIKLMTLEGRDPFRSKIEIVNKSIQHVHSFQSLFC
jgi:hypothetical protein